MIFARLRVATTGELGLIEMNSGLMPFYTATEILATEIAHDCACVFEIVTIERVTSRHMHGAKVVNDQATSRRVMAAFKVQRSTDCVRAALAVCTSAMEELRRDRRIIPFILKGELTGRQIGSGPYGSVEEASSVPDRRWRVGQLGSSAPTEGGGGGLRVSLLQTKALVCPKETPYVAHFLRLCFYITKLVIVSR